MKYTVAIYFDEPGKLDYPFNDATYLDSYREFSDFCLKRDMAIVIVRGDSYLGNMQFRGGWRFEDDRLIDIADPITVDLIYLRCVDFTIKIGPNDLVVNDPSFYVTARDKWKTYEAFSDAMPLTFQVDNDNWQEVKAKIPTDKIVLKPTYGFGGKGIIIAEKESFDFPSLDIDVPYIAQEFIDSSGGIPGICKGYHDLRIIMFNDTPTLSFIRTPKPDSYLSNIAQGGSASIIDIQKVPRSIIDLAHRIDDFYKQYTPRIYTADFFMSGDRPYLIETNTRPGFPLREAHTDAYIHQFYQSSYQVLAEAIQARRP